MSRILMSRIFVVSSFVTLLATPTAGIGAGLFNRRVSLLDSRNNGNSDHGNENKKKGKMWPFDVIHRAFTGETEMSDVGTQS